MAKRENNDKALFALIAEGNESAFEQVFNKYVGKVGKIIFRIVKSETITQDLVQEAFFYLWLGREKLSAVEDPELWLYRIAYNQSYLHIRRQVVQERAATHISKEQEQLNQYNDTEIQVNFRETKRLVQEAISTLPQRSHHIYELSRVEGLKPQVIADKLHISVQSVRNSLTRSSKIIRNYLAEHGIIIPLLLLLQPFKEIL